MNVLQKFISNNRYALCLTILFVLLAMIFINYNNNFESFDQRDDEEYNRCISNYIASDPFGLKGKREKHCKDLLQLNN